MQMHSAGPEEAWLGSSISSTPFLSPRQHSTSHPYRTESLKGHFQDLRETRTEKDSPGECFRQRGHGLNIVGAGSLSSKRRTWRVSRVLAGGGEGALTTIGTFVVGPW